MDSLTILAPAFNEEQNIIPFVSHFYEKLENNWEIGKHKGKFEKK